MSPQDLAVVSDRAVLSAGVVLTLALLAHIVEWATSLTATAERPTEVPVTVGADEPPTDATPPAADLERRELRRETAGRIGVALTMVATGLLLVGLVARAFATEPARVPWGNMYEFTLTGSFGVAAIYLALLRRHRLRWMGLFVTGFLVVVLMSAELALDTAAGPLVPALQSSWLVVHVGAAILATGAFTVGALASATYLLKERADRTDGRLRRALATVPSLTSLDRLAYRVHAVGFPLWTFAALIAGPIWAKYAWGAYWQWDPKEVWAFITWVVYAGYLHARVTAGWRGRAAAVIALVGFATLLFNFVGINFFFGDNSLHSYAG